METAYLLAITTGILGGFGHCIGMCGPIVISYTMANRSDAKNSILGRLSPHLLYNLGRITTYGIIGAIMGLSGSFLNMAGMLAGVQNVVAVLAGIMMVFMGLGITGVFGTTAWIEKHNPAILHAGRRIAASSSRLRFLSLGLVLGLLPCGLSYTVFVAAAGTGGLWSGMVTAVLFGMGTLPALVLFSMIISTLSATLRGRIHQAGGVMVMIMGAYFLFKGIKLYADL